MTEQDRANRAAAAMWAGDKASHALGIALDHIAPGRAVMTMKVRPDMLNGHGICHGGFIFTVADSAFAFACNSYNRSTVAQQNSITYLSAAKMGEVLTATAHEVSRTGRSGIYDVCVTGPDGRQIAQFRGLSRQVRGTLFDEDLPQTQTQQTDPLHERPDAPPRRP